MTETSWRPAGDPSAAGAPTTPGPATPASPLPRRTVRPTWLDLRLVTGVALVLASVLLGSVVVSNADHRESVWALDHDVAAGTVLQSGDLRPVAVRLDAAMSRYLPATDTVVGKTVRRDLNSGELLPAAALAEPKAGVTVTIPVRPENTPRLGRGDRITMWVSTRSCRGVMVFSGTPVQDVRQAAGSSFGTSGGMGVVVSVPQAQAQRVISALDLDSVVVRLGVLAGGEQSPEPTPDLATCVAPR